MRPTWPARLAPLSLGLALWTALPSLQWCTTTWKQCLSRCEATLDASGAGVERAACEAGATCAPATCEGPVSCPIAEPMAGCAAAGGCGETQDPPPPGERAWCVGIYADGVPTRVLDVGVPSAPSHPAVVVEAFRPPNPPALARLEQPAAPCPGIASAHAPPLTRAPPA